jgi:hypothetical protein
MFDQRLVVWRYRIRNQIMLKTIPTLLLIVHCSVATADEWGSIGGQIIVEGEIPECIVLIAKDAEVKDKEVCSAKEHLAEDLIIDKDSRGLANVFVYLAKKPKKIHPDLIEPPAEAISAEYKDCQLIPHCLVGRVRQNIAIGNADTIAHNPHMHALRNPQLGSLLAPRTKVPLIFRCRIAEPTPFKFGCDFHPWISAYWLIVDHPYAALTDKDGKFQIDDLPVGDHNFRIWHERFGDIDKKYTVSVTVGDPVELPAVSVSLDKLESP